MKTGFFSRCAVLAVLPVFWAGPAPAGSLPAAIAASLKEAGVPDSHIGLVVQELGSDAPALALGEGRSFNPASVMKLLTTLAALDTLGPAHTFKTRVLFRGSLADGVLHGDLILQGGGDPALTLERFWLLLREIRERGIREIRGDVIIDNGYYAIEAPDPANFDQAPLKPYNAAPTALLVNYNALPLRLAPLADAVAVRLDPAVLPLDNRLVPDRERSCNSWQDGLSISRDGDFLRLDGTYPAACGERSTWLNLMCPPATAAALFRAYWSDLAGRHGGQVRVGSAPESAQTLLEFESPPLAQIVRDVNKFSNNVMAKMLFLDLGAIRLGGGATWEKGERAIREWLSAKGLIFPELVLENGSGLSRIERLSAASVARLLQWAATQPLYYEFAASLPALGQEGTQKRRLNETPLAGRAWLKSGSLNGARNLAGYVLDTAGKRKLLVLFINHPAVAQADKVQSAVLRWAMEPAASLP